MYILILLFSLTVQAAGIPTRSPHAGTIQLPYEDRLQNLLEMAEVVPGYSEMSFQGRNLGALGGLYVQTEWQLKTGRNNIPAWRYFNFHLVVEPHTFFQDYLKDGPKDACSKYRTEVIHKNKISRERACRAWVRYFAFTDNRIHLDEPTLALKHKANEILWKAHDVAIDHALQKYPRVFTDMVNPVERDYLKGWFKFVHVLAKTDMPTSELFIRLLAKPSSPQCAPLGTPGCELKDLPVSSRIFVKQMIEFGKDSKNAKKEVPLLRPDLSDRKS